MTVAVSELHDLAEQRAASELFVSIWGRSDGDPPLAPELVRAMSHAGGYVAGAHLDGQLVGASVGFLGLDASGLILHSHITGIRPDAQGAGIGAALKQHQREWAIARGIDAITWTYDPLVRRNGRFNLHTLGARAVEYLPDFYGTLADAVNQNDPTDRCLVRWDLRDPAVVDEPDTAALLAAGADAVLRRDDRGWPQITPSVAPTQLCWVPEDIVSLRTTDAPAAAAWRAALRDTMGTAMAAGLVGVGISKDGWYVLATASS